MKIAITAESTIDMPKELLEKYDIKTVPFSITLGDEIVEDGDGVAQKIFEYVSKNKVLPKTSAVNGEQYREFFDKVLRDYDAIIHICLSSELSCACQNAKLVAQDFRNVRIIDSQSLSTGIALLAVYARELTKENYTIDQIKEKVEARVPAVQASFVLKRLDYLQKGGRCSRMQAFGANLLRLRLQIIVANGRMVPNKKFRGTMPQCIIEYVNDTLKTFDAPDLENVFITYTSADESVLEEVKTILKNRGFKNIYETTASGTITSHCGEDCFGILYINDGESK